MTAAMYDVRAMPTFMFFKNGNKVDEMKGADPTVLESKIKQWIATVNVIVCMFNSSWLKATFTYKIHSILKVQ